MAGQRKNPTTGAVTVLKPTNRQTPKRARGYCCKQPPESLERLLGVGVGSVFSSEISPLRGAMREAFFKANRRGSHASGNLKPRVSQPYHAALRP